MEIIRSIFKTNPIFAGYIMGVVVANFIYITVNVVMVYL